MKRISQINRMSLTQTLGAVVAGWAMLTDAQQIEAIRTPTPEPVKPTRRRAVAAR